MLLRLSALFVPMTLAAYAAAPDGGPWAPVLFDPETVQVSPREVRPAETVSIRFAFREGQARKVTRLRLETLPRLIELDVTDGLDADAGTFSCVVPGTWTRWLGEYELRVHMTFRWDDGKVYQRSPPFGTITIRSFARHLYTDDTFAADVAAARGERERAENALRALRILPKLQPLVDELAAGLHQAEASRAGGDDVGAKTHLADVLWRARALADQPFSAEYRFDIRQFLAKRPEDDPKPLLSILTGSARPVNAEDMTVLRELGIDTVTVRSREEHDALEREGFKTMVTPAPVRFTAKWVEDKPQFRQHRYLLSDPVIAKGAAVSMDPLLGFAHEQYDIDPAGDPASYWRVLDETAGAVVSAERWRFEEQTGQVCITGATAGHAYRVAVLVQARNLPFFQRFGDPLYPQCMGAILRRLEAHLDDRPGIDVYRPTSLFYPFPKIDKWIGEGAARRTLSWHNFYGYQWGTSPVAQKLFEKQTGISFDPLWMVDGGRYGDVNYPPRREYLAWMRFQQQNVNRCTRQVVDVAHKHGAAVRVFWGDHWMGMEPYGDFFQETGCDQIVKACKSAVVVRMTVDFEAAAKKVIRFSPWFHWGELFGRDHPIGFMSRCWRDIKRGALFRVPDGLSWGGETNTIGFQQPGILARMREITEEFRVIHALTAGHEVFRHDLNLYVVNAWGAIRPWCGWLQVNESQQILAPLTDLPVNVRFISLAEIAESGVPGDAHVLLNAGEPYSSWSGGEHWADGRVRQAVEAFVRDGGGLIGIGAPSHWPDGAQTWQLAHVLGVDFADSTREGEGDKGSFSRYDSAFLRKGPKPSGSASMKRVDATHWLTQDVPAESAPVLTKVRAKMVSDDVQLLCSGDGKTAVPPIVAARGFGAGRALYLNGYSSAFDYGSVLRRGVFWSCGREALWDAFRAEIPSVLCYLYPAAGLLAVYNMSQNTVEVPVRLDVSLLGREQADVVLRDVLSGAQIRTSTQELAAGMPLQIAPYAVRFLRVL